MTSLPNLERIAELRSAFWTPSFQSISARISSITNAFVMSILPTIVPSDAELAEAFQILEIDPRDLRCAYCGDSATEWDHLRPIVLNRRPTGYLTEIANLVPACGKCNQSKGNKSWRIWMLSKAPRSPSGRSIAGTETRMSRLERYEAWRDPIKLDFAVLLGEERWEQYWQRCEQVVREMRDCNEVATQIRTKVSDALQDLQLERHSTQSGASELSTT